MAQTQAPAIGEKRGPGRPPKAAQPALKKSKLLTPLQTPTTSSLQSPTGQSPAPEKRSNKLPSKISDHRPLPTLPEPQPASLSNAEYQSIPASNVLQTSLDRSRLKWVSEGIFDRYWTKPESGKNARPPPPNNPELKWQKHKGPCRIRIEPHIFEADIYVEEKAKPQPVPVKQYLPPQSAYGQPYRPYGQQQQQQQYGQNRALLPPIQQAMTPAQSPQNTLPPINNTSPTPAPPQRPPSRPQQSQSQPQPQQQPPPQDKKASPDPVISMLATRASSDPELKLLMKEVATGNATQDQLKVFQGHIDELTKIISEKKKREEEEEAKAKEQKPQQSEMIQYDGPADNNVAAPTPPPQTHQQPQRTPYPPTHQQPPIYQQPQQQQPQQQSWAPPPPPPPPAAPTSQPVIIQFTTPGATDDRFLFPQHSILESLSPQHLLASFIVTRRATPSLSSTLDLEPGQEYWQPVTLMVEVAYNREHILECVKRWVKPAEEVRKQMEEVMGRCRRAPEGWVPLRLPFKGAALEVEDDGVEEVTPVEREKERRGPNIIYVKKSAGVAGGKSEPGAAKEQGKDGVGKKAEGAAAGSNKGATAPAGAPMTSTPAAQAVAEKKDGLPASTDGAADENAATESGRPRRALRKSVRISEG